MVLGEDLYMGSCHTDTGKFRGHIGIVPGPPLSEGLMGRKGQGTSPWRAGRAPPLGPCT